MKNSNHTQKLLAGSLILVLLSILVIPVSAVMVGKTIEVFTGVTIYVDGVEIKPTDATGKPVDTFIYNGTTYVPLRAVSQSLGENVQWDGTTQTVYIGDDPRMTTYLLDVCPPYESRGYDAPASFKMAGQTYTHGFILDEGYNNAHALFNLNGKYDVLEFDLGHIDGSAMDDATIEIYLDGDIVEVIDVEAQDMPQHFTISLDGALQMKIAHSNYTVSYPEYGFANVVLH